MGMHVSSRPRVTPIRTLTTVAPLTRLVARRLRHEPEVVARFFMVLAIAFVLTAIPQLATHVSDRGLRHELLSTPVSRSGITVEVEGRIGSSSSGDSLADLAQRGDSYLAGLDPELRNVLQPGSYVVETPTFQPIDEQLQPLYGSRLEYPSITIRYQQDVWNHVSLVEGRMPGPRARMTPAEALGYSLADGSGRFVFEIVLTRETAEALHATIGDRFLVLPGVLNMTPGGYLDSRTYVLSVVEVVGLIEVNEPEAQLWFDDTELALPRINRQGEIVYVNATALAAPIEEVYVDLYRATLGGNYGASNWTYAWRYGLDVPAVHADKLSALNANLRRLETTHGPADILLNNADDIRIASDLPRLLDRFMTQQRTFFGLAGVFAAGVVAIALVLIALLSVIATARSERTLRLVEARGGARVQVLAAQALDVLAISLLAAACGYLLARTIVPGDIRSVGVAGWIIPAGLVLVCVVSVITTSGRMLRPDGVRRIDGRFRWLRERAPRLVPDLFIIVVATVGFMLLRRRGVAPVADGEASFDPYIAAVPALIAIAAGLSVARAIPLLASAFARVLKRRRSFLPFLVLRRLGRSSTTAIMPVVAIVLAVAIGVIASGVQGSIERTQEHDAWQTVGADARIGDFEDEAPLPVEVVQTAVADADAVARFANAGSGELDTDDGERHSLSIVGVDGDALHAVTSGTPADLALPTAALSWTSGSIPVMLTAEASDRSGLQVGDSTTIRLDRIQQEAVVVAIIERLPGIAEAENARLVLVPYDALTAIVSQGEVEIRPTALLLRHDNLTAVESSILRLDAKVSIMTRKAHLASQRDAPMIGGLIDAYRLTLLIASLFLAAIAIIAVILSAAERRRDLGVLRTVGLTRGQSAALLAGEWVPRVIIGSIAGVVAGLLIADLVRPRLRLQAFTEIEEPTPRVIEWGTIALMTTGVAGITILAVMLTTVMIRRVSLGQVLRLGDG